MGFGLLLLRDCEACGSTETRLFTDSWTALELCVSCLIAVLPSTTMSPEEEGDNLKSELLLMLGEDKLYCELTDKDDAPAVPHRI